MGEAKTRTDLNGFSVLPFFSVFTFPFLFYAALVMKGWWSIIGVASVFGIIPLGDLILGKDDVNPTKEQAKALDGQLRFRLLTWLWVPAQLSIIFGSIHCSHDETIPLWQRINFALSAGILGGAAGFNVAHELNHKRNKFEEFLAHIIFFSVGYDHFAYEHNYGHHHNVATPRDPATALYGENFYAFLPRTIIGGVKSSWKIERDVLAKKGKSVFHPSNRIIRGYLVELTILALCTYFYGLHGALMYMGQCFVAICLLEGVNYIEHYGLMREQRPDGSYEPVDPLHSWNAAERLTNYLLFKLQRHSDHHTYPYKRYQTLISHGHVGQMPTGYSGMLILAFMPPMWFKVMNPRVLELRKTLQEQKKAEAALGAAGTAKSIKGN